MANPILHFHGAAGSVTGSCFLLDTAGGAYSSIAGCFKDPNRKRN